MAFANENFMASPMLVGSVMIVTAEGASSSSGWMLSSRTASNAAVIFGASIGSWMSQRQEAALISVSPSAFATSVSLASAFTAPVSSTRVLVITTSKGRVPKTRLTKSDAFIAFKVFTVCTNP